MDKDKEAKILNLVKGMPYKEWLNLREYIDAVYRLPGILAIATTEELMKALEGRTIKDEKAT